MTEDEKRAAQTAFLSAENIQDLYRQIVSEGHINAFEGGESLTRQIAEEPTPEIDQPEIQPSREIDIEPGR